MAKRTLKASLAEMIGRSTVDTDARVFDHRITDSDDTLQWRPTPEQFKTYQAREIVLAKVNMTRRDYERNSQSLHSSNTLVAAFGPLGKPLTNAEIERRRQEAFSAYHQLNRA